jgi:thiol-disulfide isomerase/thioredoxin
VAFLSRLKESYAQPQARVDKASLPRCAKAMKKLLSVLLVAWSFGVASAGEPPPPTLALGAAAPDFTLPGVDGRDWSLGDFREAKALVVIFNCNHCPTAQAYQGRIKKLVEDYKPLGVAVVVISPNDPKSVRLDELGYTDLGDSFEEMKVRAKDEAFNFPYLYDGDAEKVSRSYGPATTPHAFLFDAQRKLRYVGRIDDAERESLVQSRDLRVALDAVLAGREPAVTQTKAFGCSIKWAGKQDLVKLFMEKLAKEPVAVELVDAAGLAALRKGEGSKVRLVNVWATWCGPCVTEFPDLIEINRMYRNREFEFVTVAANYPDEQPEVLKFLTKQQASNRNLLLASKDKTALIESFDKEWRGALPYTVLLSAKGEVLWRQEGAVDPLELKREILKAIGRMKAK